MRRPAASSARAGWWTTGRSLRRRHRGDQRGRRFLGHARRGARAYLIETAEKGVMWLRLKVTGTAGHGSMLHTDNAVAKLAAAVTRLDAHRFPLILTEPVTGLPRRRGRHHRHAVRPGRSGGGGRPPGQPVPADRRDAARHGQRHDVRGRLQGERRAVGGRATVDARMLPGREAAFEAELAEVLGPDVEREWDSLPPVQTTFDGALVDAMAAAITAEDPGARVLPYMLSAGTDAKSFDRLGIRTFRLRPAATAARPGFHRAVPRRRRARADRRPGVRRPRPRPIPAPMLTGAGVTRPRPAGARARAGG